MYKKNIKGGKVCIYRGTNYNNIIPKKTEYHCRERHLSLYILFVYPAPT